MEERSPKLRTDTEITLPFGSRFCAPKLIFVSAPKLINLSPMQTYLKCRLWDVYRGERKFKSLFEWICKSSILNNTQYYAHSSVIWQQFILLLCIRIHTPTTLCIWKAQNASMPRTSNFRNVCTRSIHGARTKNSHDDHDDVMFY